MAEIANTDPPPMHEILASIRRIITEDVPIGGSAPASAQVEDEAEDVLELGEPAPEEVVDPAAATPDPAPPMPEPVRVIDDAEGLLSQQTQAASQRALAMLSGLTIDPEAGANTMDGLVRELLRPMLKQWLDTHLPDIVERLVAREISRISSDHHIRR